MARGLVLGITRGNPITEIPQFLLFLAQGAVFGIPIPVILMFIIAALSMLSLRTPRLGGGFMRLA